MVDVDVLSGSVPQPSSVSCRGASGGEVAHAALSGMAAVLLAAALAPCSFMARAMAAAKPGVVTDDDLRHESDGDVDDAASSEPPPLLPLVRLVVLLLLLLLLRRRRAAEGEVASGAIPRAAIACAMAAANPSVVTDCLRSSVRPGGAALLAGGVWRRSGEPAAGGDERAGSKRDMKRSAAAARGLWLSRRGVRMARRAYSSAPLIGPRGISVRRRDDVDNVSFGDRTGRSAERLSGVPPPLWLELISPRRVFNTHTHGEQKKFYKYILKSTTSSTNKMITNRITLGERR